MKTTNHFRLNPGRQEGGAGGIILAILIFGAILTLGSRLGPLYLDHNTMSTVLDKMAEEPGLASKSDGQLREMLKKRFKLNNIREFDVKEHVDFPRNGEGTSVVLDYEVRMPLAGNVYMIASFNKTVELRN